MDIAVKEWRVDVLEEKPSAIRDMSGEKLKLALNGFKFNSNPSSNLLDSVSKNDLNRLNSINFEKSKEKHSKFFLEQTFKEYITILNFQFIILYREFMSQKKSSSGDEFWQTLYLRLRNMGYSHYDLIV